MAQHGMIAHATEVTDFGGTCPCPHAADFGQGIRVYKSSPSGATVQIRHYGSTDSKRRGVKRYLVAGASYVTQAELDILIAALRDIRDSLQA